MSKIEGLSNRWEIDDEHNNGEFLANHYVEPPLSAIEASERRILEIGDEDKKPPVRQSPDF